MGLKIVKEDITFPKAWEKYTRYLIKLTGAPKEWNKILRYMHTIRYEFDIHDPRFFNDKNRMGDAIYWRNDYFRKVEVTKYIDIADSDILDGGASVLEVLWWFSDRLHLEWTGISVDDGLDSEWFWIFVKTLGIDEFTPLIEVEARIRKWMAKEYGRCGEDGNILYIPNLDEDMDMRDLEMWRQAMAFITYNREIWSDKERTVII